MLSPDFHAALMSLRSACCDLSRLRLHGLESGGQYTLEELKERQAEQEQVKIAKAQMSHLTPHPMSRQPIIELRCLRVATVQN